MDIDYSKLDRIADTDPELDKEDFKEQILTKFDKSISKNKQDYSESGSSENVYRMSGISVDPRGSKSRPGLGPAELRNNNFFMEETEVYNGDKIPIRTYKKMAADPEISFGTKLIKSWIGSLPFSIETGDRRIKRVLEYALGNVWSSLVRDLLDSIILGFSFGEKVWQREDVILSDSVQGKEKIIFNGKIVSLEKIKFLDPTLNFSYYKNKKDEITKVEQWSGSEKITVDRDKLVWFALDKKYSGVFGQSRYKNIYTQWYYSKVNHKYTLNDLQKRGSPHIEVRYPEGTTILDDGSEVDNSVVARKIAEQLTSDGVVAMPSRVNEEGEFKWSVKYADTKQDSSKSPFIDYLKYSDKKKLKGLGVPPAVTDGDSNFSTLDAQGDMLVIIVEDIVNQLEEVIQKDVVNDLVDHNFGPKAKSLVDLKIDKSALGRRQISKEILKNMIRTGSSMEGKTLASWPDPASLMNELGITNNSFDKVFTDAQGTGRSENDPVSKEEKKERSNDTDRSRDPDDENRDRQRPSERESVTESN